jgi:hypothetical protein
MRNHLVTIVALGLVLGGTAAVIVLALWMNAHGVEWQRIAL